jgi:hypothetical protein
MFYCQDAVHVDGGLPEYIFEYRRPESDAYLASYTSYDKWCTIVERYTAMKLSVLSDRLPAISAIAETFGTTVLKLSTPGRSYKAGL